MLGIVRLKTISVLDKGLAAKNITVYSTSTTEHFSTSFITLLNAR